MRGNISTNKGFKNRHVKPVKPARVTLRRGRLLLLVSVFFLIFLTLVSRLYYIMIIKGKNLKAMAVKQWTSTIPISPKRGSILDRNGQMLSISSDVYRIDADLKTLEETLSKKNMTTEELAEQLSQILGIDLGNMKKKLQSTDNHGNPLMFVSLKRMSEKSEADALKNLNLHGLLISADTKRYYPENNFLAQVLGHINMEGAGVTGLELAYNKILTGIPGIKVVETDKVQNDLPYTEEYISNSVDGKDILLTIDEKIQELAERTAEDALIQNKAKSVSITIMNPKNGEILAMANKPDFDPNYPNKIAGSQKDIQEMWKNNAVENIFEPGSIFKVITAAAALEHNTVTENDTFVCNGSIKVGKEVLFCDKGKAHGVETISDIIKNSCNVGFVQLAQKLGKSNLVEFARSMGFGQKTGVDLPGESEGILRGADGLKDVEFATMSYGQGLALTQVQYLAAFNAVANGGTWIKPHIMSKIVHMEGNRQIIDKEFSDYNKRTVMGKEDAAKLRGYLERVVKEGTATATYIENYHIAGKTGTALKVNSADGKYDKYVSSFAGMAPANDPVVTLIVTIDEPDPSKYYAGETAVPAAKQLFSEIFKYIPLK